MYKKVLLLSTLVLLLTILVAPVQTEAAAKTFSLTKEKWVENHYDAKVFAWNNDYVCAAGPYANEIRTYCTTTGVKDWKTYSEAVPSVPPTLEDGDAEFIDLDRVIVWNDELYYIVDRGAGASNNDTGTVEVWQLQSDNTWLKVFSYQNESAYFIDATTTNKRMYLFVYRYDTNPSRTFYYTTKDGVSWTKTKRRNTPKNITGVAVANGTLYAFNNAHLFERRASGYWKKKHSLTSTATEYNYFSELASYNNKLYMVKQTYTYDNVGSASDPLSRKVSGEDLTTYDLSYTLMSSKKGKTWTTKTLSDKSIYGSETMDFHVSGDKLYLMMRHSGKKRDVLWKVPKKVKNLNTTKHKKIIPKTTAMKNNAYYLIDYTVTAGEYYFADSEGNIYKK